MPQTEEEDVAEKGKGCQAAKLSATHNEKLTTVQRQVS